MADVISSQDNTESIQETLNHSDFGHWMYEHRKAFMSAVVMAFIAISGWLLYKQYVLKQAKEQSAMVSTFEQTVMTEFRASKLTPAEFAQKFQALDVKVKTSPSMLPVILEATQTMDSKNETALAVTLLKEVVESIGVKSPFYIFIAFNYAALSEKAGQTDEAIKTLETYVAQGFKVMLPMAYLELGRLYIAKSDTAKAKKNFDYIIANYPNDELAKMARLYLQQLPAAQ
ncbi:MAG: tetratricopeptide repeat protein [Bacteriovoracaceae bacterium]|nr:tetratricopeptide repeat protein [Bacteriovoracaceae bacterium]